MSETWHVYMLQCSDESLYIGVARDLERRLEQHNGDRPGGARYTRSRRPVRLLWSETALDRSAALQREVAIKRWRRAEKLRLVGR